MFENSETLVYWDGYSKCHARLLIFYIRELALLSIKHIRPNQTYATSVLNINYCAAFVFVMVGD